MDYTGHASHVQCLLSVIPLVPFRPCILFQGPSHPLAVSWSCTPDRLDTEIRVRCNRTSTERCIYSQFFFFFFCIFLFCFFFVQSFFCSFFYFIFFWFLFLVFDSLFFQHFLIFLLLIFAFSTFFVVVFFSFPVFFNLRFMAIVRDTRSIAQIMQKNWNVKDSSRNRQHMLRR